MVLGHDITVGERTQDVRIAEDVSFDSMMLNNVTIRGLRDAGFLRPSPVQLRGIPLGKCGFDLLLEAKSGTGKTAVFTIIALEKLDLKKGLQTIILAPTREIASQISDVIVEIGSKYKHLNVAVVMGGLPVNEDIAKFKENVHIVVGSPGRLRHLIQDKHIDTSSVRLFILDEADKLMESSFLPDINYIFSLLPKQKQVIMSSATYSDKAKAFVSKYVQKAIHVCPDSNSILLGIAQKIVTVPHNTNIVKQTKYRYEQLKKILNEKQFKQCLIFCNYQVRVGEVHRMLCRDKWPAEQLYGLQDQCDRLDALKILQEYKCRILVSTDLAARGIDASNVDIVVNFEPPFEWETYLHRIGRAGRYGSYGTAITILSEGKETAKFKETLALTKIPFQLQNLWDDEPVNMSLEETTNSLETNEMMLTDSAKNSNLKNVDQLWKSLTSSIAEDDVIKPLSSFEEMCNSFKKCSELKIESFEDLVASFNTNNNNFTENKDISEYKHVKTNLVDIVGNKCKRQQKNSQANITSSKNSLTTNKNNHKETYLTEKMEKNTLKDMILECQINVNQVKNQANKNLVLNPEAVKSNAMKPDHPIRNGDITKKTYGHDLVNNETSSINTLTVSRFKRSSNKTEDVRSVEDKSQPLEYNEINNIDETEEHCYSDEAAADPVKQALLDAGLPTAFGKKYTQRHKSGRSKRSKYNSYKNYNIEITTKTEVDDHTQNESHNNCDNVNNNNLDVINHYNTRLLENNSSPVEKSKEKYKGKVNTWTSSNTNDEHKSKVKQISRKHVNNQEMDTPETMKLSKANNKLKGKYCKKSSVSNEELDLSETVYCDMNAYKPVHTYLAQENISNSMFNYQNNTRKSNRSIEEYRSKQFDLWYSQLKQHTQYIQQILYFETLRNV